MSVPQFGGSLTLSSCISYELEVTRVSWLTYLSIYFFFFFIMVFFPL